MKVIPTAIEGVVILEPEVFGDARGYFFESYSQRKFDEQVRLVRFVQDNESHSRYGVLISAAALPRSDDTSRWNSRGITNASSSYLAASHTALPC